jgi:hypothetical protein
MATEEILTAATEVFGPGVMMLVNEAHLFSRALLVLAGVSGGFLAT